MSQVQILSFRPHANNPNIFLTRGVFGLFVDDINDELLGKFIPVLNYDSKEAIFQKILDGKMDWHFIKVLLPYADYITTQIEAAVATGALPWEVLDVLNDYYWNESGFRRKKIKGMGNEKYFDESLNEYCQ